MRTFTHGLSISSFSLLGLFALTALASAGCGEARARAPEVATERAIPVVVTHPVRGRLSRTIRAAGVLSAKRELDLSFKVPGIVQRVFVEEGARVRAGQPLARLDPVELAAAEHQAEEAYTKAQRDVERARKLHAQNGVPQSVLDDAETALVLARAARESAAFNARQTTLVAPDDGVIERRMLEVGEVVAPGRPVLHLKSGLGSVVKVGLVDRDVLSVKLGDRAEVELDALPGQPFAARISRVATSRTLATGTYEVELALLDARAALEFPSGLTAKVSFVREESALSVPLTALVDGDREEASVFVLEGDRAQRTRVRVDAVEGERATLLGGLDEQARVVSTGAAELRDGALVRVAGEE